MFCLQALQSLLGLHFSDQCTARSQHYSEWNAAVLYNFTCDHTGNAAKNACEGGYVVTKQSFFIRVICQIYFSIWKPHLFQVWQ